MRAWHERLSPVEGREQEFEGTNREIGGGRDKSEVWRKPGEREKRLRSPEGPGARSRRRKKLDRAVPLENYAPLRSTRPGGRYQNSRGKKTEPHAAGPVWLALRPGGRNWESARGCPRIRRSFLDPDPRPQETKMRLLLTPAPDRGHDPSRGRGATDCRPARNPPSAVRARGVYTPLHEERDTPTPFPVTSRLGRG
jgi:hypothetical protein